MKSLKLASAVVAALVLSTSANAALIERLGGLAYYDDQADLTWLADANYAGTSGNYHGRMNWADANAWAAGLIVGGVDGWRLPGTDPGISGYNQTGSEMGNLFYNVLGGVAGSSITTIHNTNYDLFSNVRCNACWSATEYAPNTAAGAWVFTMVYGYQDAGNKTNLYSAWAMQSGDVSAVPVPAAVWLFGSGLIGLAGIARRKKA